MFKKLKLCIMSLSVLIGTAYSQQSMIEQSLPYSGLIYYENNSKLYISYLLTRIEQNYVMVEWRGAKLPGLSYQLYRHHEPITDYSVISKSTLIATVNADSKTIDYRVKDVLPRRGTYYYAIACILNNSQIIFTGTPGIDMTARAIELDINDSVRYNLAKPYTDGDSVRALGYAKQSSGNNVLYWQEAPNYSGNYLVYKSDKVIDNIKNLNKAKLVGKTQSSFFVDALTTDDESAYYYVVIDDKKKKDIYSSGSGQMINVMENLNAAPPSTPKKVLVRNFNVVNDTSRVVLNWQTPAVIRSTSYFILVTSSIPFKTGMNVFDNQGIIDIKNIDYNSVSFINDSGKYLFVPRKREYLNAFIYYALIAVEDINVDSSILLDGMFTKYPVKISTLQAIETKREGTPGMLQSERSLDIPRTSTTQSPSSDEELSSDVYYNDTTDNTKSNVVDRNNPTFVLPPINIFDDVILPDNNKSTILDYPTTNFSLPPTNGTNYIYSNANKLDDEVATNNTKSDTNLYIDTPKILEKNEITNTYKTNEVKVVEKNEITNTYKTNEVKVVEKNENTQDKPKQDNNNLKNTKQIDEKYSDAVKFYNKRNYKGAVELLEGISYYKEDLGFYCDVNLLLGRSYYMIKNKSKSISAFRRAYDGGANEASIWIKKVMNEL